MKLWFNQHRSDNIDNTDNTCYDVRFCHADFNLAMKSDFTPSASSNAIDTFINLVKKDISALRSEVMNNIRHPNKSRDEIEALKELAQNTNITIKSTDNGGGIVIMDTSKYNQEIKRQLSDKLFIHV